ncbi:MAG: hypothetical protein K1X86_15850 [Ignavibacteria bacterium]|nr:hypothetical protein [Ignavibacteria bacterium]
MSLFILSYDVTTSEVTDNEFKDDVTDWLYKFGAVAPKSFVESTILFEVGDIFINVKDDFLKFLNSKPYGKTIWFVLSEVPGMLGVPGQSECCYREKPDLNDNYQRDTVSKFFK